MRKRTMFVFVFLLCVITISSCQKEEIFPSMQRGTLVEVKKGGTFTKTQLRNVIPEEEFLSLIEYDVSYYKVKYRTEYQGKPIDSEGLLLIPEGVDTIRLITYLHGTHVPLDIFKVKRSTPSLYDGGNKDFFEVRTFGFTWASAGFAIFLPDYIGYGITSDKEHPYVYYPELFKANIDGLLASKSYIKSKGFTYNDELYITGWSQGGGAALSAHQYTQESYASDFRVIATSALAGPYNFSGFMRMMFEEKDEKYAMLSLYTWAGYCVNKFSRIGRPTDQIFSYPVHDQASAFNPPSSIPEKVFNNLFIKEMLTDANSEFDAVIAGNSFHQGWLPVGKVFLHHGEKDDIVPYFNSASAYEGLTSAGGDITLYSYPEGDHVSEVVNYALTTLRDFKETR